MRHGDLKKIAQNLGVSPSAITHILKGRMRPSPYLALRLEQLTNVDLRIWLFGSAEDRKNALTKALNEAHSAS